MKKGKGTTVVIGVLIIVSAVILYSNSIKKRMVTEDEVEISRQEELELLLDVDLDKDYPKDPRGTVEMFSRIIQMLYENISDEVTDVLALKIRELYDEELLAINSEKKYLNDLYTELAAIRESETTISKYLFVNEDQEGYDIIDGQEYANIYVSYTMKQKSRYIETKEFILRKDEEGKWKILGWGPYKED